MLASRLLSRAELSHFTHQVRSLPRFKIFFLVTLQLLIRSCFTLSTLAGPDGLAVLRLKNCEVEAGAVTNTAGGSQLSRQPCWCHGARQGQNPINPKTSMQHSTGPLLSVGAHQVRGRLQTVLLTIMWHLGVPVRRAQRGPCCRGKACARLSTTCWTIVSSSTASPRTR